MPHEMRLFDDDDIPEVETWADAAAAAVDDLAASGVGFTAGSVLRRLNEWGWYTERQRDIGPHILNAKRRGLIRKTNEWRNTGSHGRPQPVWIANR